MNNSRIEDEISIYDTTVILGSATWRGQSVTVYEHGGFDDSGRMYALVRGVPGRRVPVDELLYGSLSHEDVINQMVMQSYFGSYAGSSEVQ